MDYDEAKELNHYIWRFYQHYMTKFEWRVGAAYHIRAKAKAYKLLPEKEAMYQQKLGHRGDLKVMEALKADEEVFRREACKRLLEDHKDQIFINRCPKCQKIVRTPKAKMCLWCGSSWHPRSENNE